MATKIQWTDQTWNPVIGCSKISAGCDNCYAEAMAGRLATMKATGDDYSKVVRQPSITSPVLKWNGRTAFVESALEKPLRWKKPRKVFLCSMGDLFHESVPFEWIDKVMAVIALCPQHTFQILTKRPRRMREYFIDQYPLRSRLMNTMTEIYGSPRVYDSWSLPNLWLGVTCENQRLADDRIPALLGIPAAVRFISIEPMLEEVVVGYAGANWIKELDWVIVGAESGPNRRQCKLWWVENIVSEAGDYNTPVFVKQLDIDGKVSKDMSHWPDELKIRLWPYIIHEKAKELQ